MTGTVTLHRVLRASPDKVFRAFTDPDALARWLPPEGFTARVEELDVRVGGRFRMSFCNFTTGNAHHFGGQYIEVEPGRRLVYTDVFDDPGLPGEMVTTVVLAEVVCGTSIHIEQKGIPEMIPEPMCYLGWQESLQFLAKLVEPNIPDE
ncbi:SRPBCC family protein [Spongiibacter taiwanensis]|uniref:SRPBCC family protein n=1 Tax=Spongiibacter taiwanensis TaxID=1748242 RepID=UPI0020358ABC|nr:SRPBCC family protein [Spongiibacter taiwanensis]USA42206.1 SRPBCC family protein [Spongiibacter taiwanensis]